MILPIQYDIKKLHLYEHFVMKSTKNCIQEYWWNHGSMYIHLHSLDDVYMCRLGHFIHFMADGAFQDLNINLLGYFNNCQFPNVVYKALTCFKCSSKGSQICSLGHEVSELLSVILEGYLGHEVSEFGKVLLSVILWYLKGSLDHELGNLSRV